jgi:hypothetical protein
MEELSGRERSIRAMNFEPTDRLPIMANILPPKFVQEVTAITEEEYWSHQLKSHFESMKAVGMDFHVQNWLPVKAENERQWSPGQFERWRDLDVVVEDLERRAAQLEEKWQYLRVSPQEREKRIQKICDYQRQIQGMMGDDLLWVFGMDFHGPHIIEFPYEEYGYEAFFLICALHPDALDGFWAAVARLARWHNECVVEAAERLDWPRIGYLGTDVTDQRGNMVSPHFMDRYWFPHLDHAVAPLVEAGFKLVWHSDGNMNAMLQPLIDIGMAGFQGFQEECGTRIADVAKLRTRDGDPLLLWGSVSVITVVRRGTFRDIAREVQRVLDEWPHPGLCLGTSSYISPDVPHENIIELFRLMRTLGAVQRGL